MGLLFEGGVINMVKISVIIPIYNCEQYIEQCVRSVLRQTLKDLEVICVDDGSTDQSVQVLRELMRTDERIILCQQKNQGPGIARNTGMKRAEGKYIAFLLVAYPFNSDANFPMASAPA